MSTRTVNVPLSRLLTEACRLLGNTAMLIGMPPVGIFAVTWLVVASMTETVLLPSLTM